jgi:2-oxoisovalerate dehydrogenase E1 component
MTEVAADRTGALSDDDLVDLYALLLVPRLIEEKMLRLLRQGRLSKWFSGIGQEAIAVGVTWSLEADDWILPMHRNLGVWTTRGVDLDRLLRQLLARQGGFTGGRDRTFHFGRPSDRIIGMISHLGAMQPVADGLALAATLRGERRVAVTFLGEGATSEGDVHEAMNLAAVWKLPVLFVVENNGYGLSTPTSEQYACVDLADRGAGYGMPGVVCDGNDVIAVIDVVSEAARRARAGDGPTLLEFKTFRMRGHEEASGTGYVPPGLFEQWAARDPIVRLEARLDEHGLLEGHRRDELRAKLAADIDARVAAAFEAPEPASTREHEAGAVFAVNPAAVGVSRPTPGPARELRYLDAISDGLRVAMRNDPTVVLIGQDIAEYGGAFKATLGFLDEFGRARVRNTPIIESAALGAALGLAIDGFRPMVEMQFADFISCGFNQIVNNLATTHYRWGTAVPAVIRAPVGGGMGAGPFHSQDIEGWFTHVPGLKVVAPSTPADAKGLLLAAFDDRNPVLYLEHKFLYRKETGSVPEGWYTVPIGQAAIARPGTDVTVVTYGVGVAWALEAAERLAAEDGAEVEVVDLRSLVPWDVAAVLASVERTGRALVLHEAPVTGGFGGEVAATIGDRGFASLDAPVRRLGALDTPVPFAKPLEALHSPRDRLVPALRDLLAY